MKTRKVMIVFNLVGMVAYFICVFINAYLIGNSKFNGNIWLILPSLLGCMGLLISSFSLHSVIRYDDFFDTYDELKEKLDKANESIAKSNKLIEIIGQHEAVKMWEAEKLKETK